MLLAEIAIVPLAIAGILGLGVGLVIGLLLRRHASESSPVDAAAELEALREQQQNTLNELRKRIADVQSAKAKAEAERARVVKGLNEITGSGSDGVTIALASAKEMAEHARQLEKHEGAVAAHDEELDHLADELSAAEELLRDVDTQRNSLESQLKDKDRELWKLRNEIEGVRRKSSEQRARTMMLTRSNVRKAEIVANRIEDQLKHWVKKTGEVNVNFSEHGHAVVVKDFFGKLDREFIDRYFSHATNPEYERGKRKAIHITAGRDDSGAEYGELRVALDDDAGRTLGLRFELKKTAPDPKAVGLVLAMYLRALHRDLRDFEVLA